MDVKYSLSVRKHVREIVIREAAADDLDSIMAIYDMVSVANGLEEKINPDSSKNFSHAGGIFDIPDAQQVKDAITSSSDIILLETEKHDGKEVVLGFIWTLLVWQPPEHFEMTGDAAFQVPQDRLKDAIKQNSVSCLVDLAAHPDYGADITGFLLRYRLSEILIERKIKYIFFEVDELRSAETNGRKISLDLYNASFNLPKSLDTGIVTKNIKSRIIGGYKLDILCFFFIHEVKTGSSYLEQRLSKYLSKEPLLT